MICPNCRHENPTGSTYCGKCAARLDSPDEPRPVFTETLDSAREELATGSTFAGRYKVIEELGQGGMGTVYKVHDTKVGEKIALKLIRPEAGFDRKSLDRFSNELKLARKVRHKNVCQMFDLGEDQGTRYITMEYIHGEDLRQLIRKVGRLSSGQAVAISRQVCQGLEEAHKLGIVHRDLKPQNIMLDEDGNARIMDFGIARSLTGRGITGAGVLLGTPEYMSPEQVEGKDVDHRSDFYSLGVILYEMVTGRRPFDGETPLSIAHKHKYEPPEDPRKIDPQVPEDLARVILKCLEKDKVARYKSARALDTDLAAVEGGLPTAEKAVPKRRSAATRDITVTFNLRKLALPVLAGVALVAAAVVFLLFIGRKKPPQAAPQSSGKPSIAVMYFDNQTDKEGLDRMLVTLLTTNLSRYENIEVTSTQRLFDILKLLGKQDAQVIDKSLATEVATRAGVQTMLLGSVIQIGGRLRLVSELFDVQSGSIVGTQSADGTSYDDVFPMVDSITEQVGEKIGSARAGERLKVADVTTSSLEALNCYQKGHFQFLRWNFREAEKFFQEAVEIDPTFAMAYANLAMAQIKGGIGADDPYCDLTSARTALRSAKRHSDKATESERIMIKMIEAILERDLARAAEFGRDLLVGNDSNKLAILAVVIDQFSRLDLEGVIRTMERALEVDPSEGNWYNMIAYGHGRLGDYPAAFSAVKKYLAVHPDVANAYDSAWDVNMMAGQWDEALRYADLALQTHPGWHSFDYRAGWALIHKGDGEGARERFRRLERNSPAWRPDVALDTGCSYLREGQHRKAEAELRRALSLYRESGDTLGEIKARLSLGEALLIGGEFKEALVQFAEAEEMSGQYYKHDFNPIPLARRLYSGRAFLRQGEPDRAEAAAEEIGRMVKKEKMAAVYLHFRRLLDAEIALARNKPEETVRLLKEIDHHGWRTSPFYWLAKAEAEEALGRFDQATEGYLKFSGMVELARTSLCEPVRYFYELSMVDYNLGRIAEKTKDLAAAGDHYRKFLEGMKAADPGIAEVEDARQRLAALDHEAPR